MIERFTSSAIREINSDRWLKIYFEENNIWFEIGISKMRDAMKVLCACVCFILEWYISMNIGDKLNMFLTWFRFQVMEIFIKMIIFRFNGFKVRSFASSSFMFYVRMRSLLNEICICLLIISLYSMETDVIL